MLVKRKDEVHVSFLVLMKKRRSDENGCNKIFWMSFSQDPTQNRNKLKSVTVQVLCITRNP